MKYFTNTKITILSMNPQFQNMLQRRGIQQTNKIFLSKHECFIPPCTCQWYLPNSLGSPHRILPRDIQAFRKLAGKARNTLFIGVSPGFLNNSGNGRPVQELANIRALAETFICSTDRLQF